MNFWDKDYIAPSTKFQEDAKQIMAERAEGKKEVQKIWDRLTSNASTPLGFGGSGNATNPCPPSADKQGVPPQVSASELWGHKRDYELPEELGFPDAPSEDQLFLPLPEGN